MKNKTICVTGSSGFIGGYLVKKLKELEYKVIGFDIKNSVADDIRNPMSVKALFKNNKIDTVIHLAALTGVRGSNAIEYFETNITGTNNLLEMAKKYGVKNFLSASSSSVYGEQKCPLKESDEGIHLLSYYAISKKSGELLCEMHKDLSTIVFRPFTVYGDNINSMRKNMVLYKLLNAATNKEIFEKYGDGNSSRGYTNVHDLIDGIVKLIDYKPKDNFEIFNLGGSEEIKLNDFIKIIKKEFSDLKIKQIEKNLADIPHSLADISKAKQKIGWNPNRIFNNEIKKLCLKLKN